MRKWMKKEKKSESSPFFIFIICIYSSIYYFGLLQELRMTDANRIIERQLNIHSLQPSIECVNEWWRWTEILKVLQKKYNKPSTFQHISSLYIETEGWNNLVVTEKQSLGYFCTKPNVIRFITVMQTRPFVQHVTTANQRTMQHWRHETQHINDTKNTHTHTHTHTYDR